MVEIGDPPCSYGRIYTVLSRGLPKEKIAAGVLEKIPHSSSENTQTACQDLQPKGVLPLWAISSSGQGLSLEFQIIQDATAPANSDTGKSTSWQLEKVRVYGKVLHCSDELLNTYAKTFAPQ